MNDSKKEVIFKKIQRTIENLTKNNMEAFYAEKKEDILPLLDKLIAKDSVVAYGGSATLQETNLMEYLRNGNFRLLDRDKTGLSQEEKTEIYRKAFSADFYLASANAITESGLIYQVDGNSNRVAAILYGPSNVILVAGYNKIVKTLDDAVSRVKNIAAPANAVRLERNTPCTKVGYCCDCKSEDRICCNFVVMAQQRYKNRVKVIIVGEELGF